MNAQTTMLLGRFSLAARKEGIKIDLTQLVKDKEYAKEIFARMDESADEDLLVLSINVRDHLGLLQTENVGAAEATQETKVPEGADGKSTQEKYLYGARG